MGQSRLSFECTFVKWFLILFQLVQLALGGLLIWFGVFIEDVVKQGAERYDFNHTRVIEAAKKFTELSDDTVLNYIGYQVIAVGSVVCFVALVGLLGTCCQNRGFLCCYSCLIAVTLIVLLTLTAFVLLLLYVAPVRDEVLPNVKKYNWTNEGASENAQIHRVQTLLGCCGRSGYQDWDKGRPAERSTEYPISCCSDRILDGSKCTLNDSSLVQIGCEQRLQNIFLCPAIVLGSTSGLTLLVMLFTYCLMCGIGTALRRYDSEPAVFYSTSPDSYASDMVRIGNKTHRTRF